MENKPLVSIISPTYNHEKYIRQCIESVLSQTFTNWEMLIIDDCSTDNTGSIIKKFNDSRIKYTRHSYNYGKEKLAQLHNEALAIARGEFITILEGDDYWPEDRLEIQIKKLKENPESILCHGSGIIVKDYNYTIWYYPLKFTKDIIENNPVGSALKIFLCGYNFMLAQSIMIKKEFLLRIGGFKQIPSLFLVDYPTWMELSLSGRFGFIPEVLGYWRKHSGSITNIYNENIWLGMAEYSEIFISNHKDEIKKLSVRLDNYIKYPGSYAYAFLFKIKLKENKKKEAKKYFKKVWETRKSLSMQNRVKVLILSLCLFIPFFPKIYRKYIKLRTSKISA